jgi:voltage-gated potassium channel Kch
MTNDVSAILRDLQPAQQEYAHGRHKDIRAYAASAASLAILLATACTTLALAQPSPISPAATSVGSSAQFDVATRRKVAEAFAAALAESYARAEVGQKMAQVIRNRLKVKAYDGITSRAEFARALQADAQSVAFDKHLRVMSDAPPMPNGPPPPGMMAQMRAENGAIRKVQILPGNIGYMEVNGVPPVMMSKAAIAAAFAFLHNTDALILDLRGNGGGDPNTVAMYMSYLSEGAPYIVNTIHNRRGNVDEFKTTDLGELSYGRQKPVFCLTSRRTFSGGEELSYDIKAFKRGLVIGETTGGGANPAGPRPLGDGFVAGMPFGYTVHPVTGTSWEGVGVKPDVEVEAEQALTEAQRLAVDRLKANATDLMQRAALDVLSLSFQAEAGTQSGVAAAPNRLTGAQLIGSYKSAGGPEPSITEKAGSLFLQFPSAAPPARLVPLGGDRYHVAGLPVDFIATFSEQDGKVQLVAALGNWPPIVAAKK